MAKVSLRGMRRRTVDFESLWLITFADLMVQLMAFFAVVYSFSIQDQRKLGDLVRSFQKAVGIAQNAPTPGSLPQPGAGQTQSQPVDLEKLLSDLKSVDGPEVGTKMRIVTFRGSVLFEEGSTALDPVFQRMLDRIADLNTDYPGFFLVCEGHAAPQEKGRGGVDAMELSGQRAQAVVRYLVQRGADPAAISAEARGDATLEGDASSPEGRALQRQVKFRYQRVAAK